MIRESVKKCFEESSHRRIVSAGCEIPPSTSIENFRAYRDTAKKLRNIKIVP